MIQVHERILFSDSVDFTTQHRLFHQYAVLGYIY